MRVVADIPNPHVKITLHSYNGKYILKLEKANLEQIYKIEETEVMGDEGAKALIDDDFIEAVVNRFVDMRDAFVSTMRRNG
ncbi:hypothetical protein [Pontibacter chinhatensis]|uniref:Uncharacterized protein n=1 Tax=Pontibacter chinhatensis TaxID=1436961 RepID=A0A1I2VMB6_9BACT|nr:hypothetical protein [Pontibacter chinhatensis]SFG90203.1 hypothetical protein SAMN05421739_104253 [Pontibacter chinhatensis]